MPFASTLSRLADVPEDQWGLITRRQAEAARVPPATITRLIAGAAYSIGWRMACTGLSACSRLTSWTCVPLGSSSHPKSRHGNGLLRRVWCPIAQPQRCTVSATFPPTATSSPCQAASSPGLPVTRPSRIAADLLAERNDPQAVDHLVTDAIRGVFDYPGAFAQRLAPYATPLGLRKGDGLATLRWLLELAAVKSALRTR